MKISLLKHHIKKNIYIEALALKTSMKAKEVVFLVSVLCILALCSQLSIAADIMLASDENNDVIVAATAVKSIISRDQFAVFNITLINNGFLPEHVFLQLNDPRWSLTTDPIIDYTAGISLSIKGKKQALLMIKPFESIPLGDHSLIVQAVDSDNKVLGSDLISIKVTRQYISDNPVEISIDAPDQINPRRANSIKVNLKNNNDVMYRDVKVELKGKFFAKELDLSLEPLKSKTVEFTVTVGNVPPQDDILTASLKDNETIIVGAEKPIRYAESFGPFDTATKRTSDFLKITDIIMLENRLSSLYTQEIKVRMQLLDDILTKTIPKASVVKEGTLKFYVWNVTLSTNERISLIIERDYSALVYSIMGILIIIMIYYFARNPIRVIKSIKSLKTVEEGISEVKIILDVRNRSSKTIEDLELIERIPNLSAYVKGQEIETLAPSQVSKYHKGTILRWHMILDPKEERIITYKIHTRLSVLGGLRLQPAIAKFKVNGKHEEAFSNKVGIMAEVVVRED